MTAIPTAATLHVLRLAEPATARQIMRPSVPAGAADALAGTDIAFQPDGLFTADPTLVFVFVRWSQVADAIDHVRRGSPETWSAPFDEAWHAALGPYRFRGEVNWADGPLFDVADAAPDTDEPIVTMTTTAFSDDQSKALALGAAMHEVQAAGGAGSVPGQLRTAVSLGRKRDDGRTFTLWRSEADALAWAHRREPHRTMLRRQVDEQLMPRSSFTRFAVLASQGTWAGADPLADGGR